MRVHQQDAYILLNRAYSESSWIVEIFSRDYGRLALMAKGARRLKSKLKGTLLPFQPTLLSWTGKGEVPTLTSAELNQTDYSLLDQELSGDVRVCGFYCNELITNLLHRHDPHSRLYDHYHKTIKVLGATERQDQLGWVVRDFERIIIKEAGYAVNFEKEADGKTAIVDSENYLFQPGQGFVRTNKSQHNSISGRAIRGIINPNSEILTSLDVSQGKWLMRDILTQTLGHKPIVSRSLFYPKPGKSQNN